MNPNTGSPRGAEGTAAKEVLATIFGSWLLNSHNPFFACRDMLISPKSELLPAA